MIDFDSISNAKSLINLSETVLCSMSESTGYEDTICILTNICTRISGAKKQLKKWETGTEMVMERERKRQERPIISLVMFL